MKYLETPIPNIKNKLTAQDYHIIPINFSDVRSIEKLVNPVEFGISAVSYYARTDKYNSPYNLRITGSLDKVWCREGVIKKILDVNKILKSFNLEVHIVDGYRPVELQQGLWDYAIEMAKTTLSNPTPKNCEEFVGQYYSDPRRFDLNDFTTWPTHSTGGAVDLTLKVINSNELLYMGGIFDDSSEVSHTSYYENSIRHESLSDLEARKNRRVLYWAMYEAGFVNYPYEWWHFDLGTQMGAMNKSLEDSSIKLDVYYGYAGDIYKLI